MTVGLSNLVLWPRPLDGPAASFQLATGFLFLFGSHQPLYCSCHYSQENILTLYLCMQYSYSHETRTKEDSTIPTGT